MDRTKLLMNLYLIASVLILLLLVGLFVWDSHTAGDSSADRNPQTPLLASPETVS